MDLCLLALCSVPACGVPLSPLVHLFILVNEWDKDKNSLKLQCTSSYHTISVKFHDGTITKVIDIF